MKKMIKLALCLGLVTVGTQAQAGEPIPQESGLSGFVQLGAGYTSMESNMVAGDLGRRTTSSINSSPSSESDVAPLINGELKYTFGSTRTQVFFGNSLEDALRYDLTSQLGVRQEVGKAGIMGVGVLFTAMPTEVWKDPYVANARRSNTDRTSQGIRVSWENIFGSRFDVRVSAREIELDDEESGTALGLTAAQQKLLDREGDQVNITGEYTIVLNQKNFLTPSVFVTSYDLDGDAMASDEIGLRLTHSYLGEKFNFITNIFIGTSENDKRNPIYGKTQEDDSYGAGFIAMYKKFMDVEGLSLVGNIAYYDVDSNIDFYDGNIFMTNVSCLYRF